MESGKAVEEEIKENEFLTKCVNCQTTVPSNIFYCWSCGKPVSRKVDDSPEEVGPPKEKEKKEKTDLNVGKGPNDRYVCPDCGKVYGPYNNSRGAYRRHRRKAHGDI